MRAANPGEEASVDVLYQGVPFSFDPVHPARLIERELARQIVEAEPLFLFGRLHYVSRSQLFQRGGRVGVTLDQITEQWISDAEVAKTVYTAFESTEHPVTARLVVRRVHERNPAPPGQEELFRSGATTSS